MRGLRDNAYISRRDSQVGYKPLSPLCKMHLCADPQLNIDAIFLFPIYLECTRKGNILYNLSFLALTVWACPRLKDSGRRSGLNQFINVMLFVEQHRLQWVC